MSFNKKKKYTIHILAIGAIDSETFDLPKKQNAVIVCAEHDNPNINMCLPENVLLISFPDVKNKNYPGAFSAAHARKIISFINNLSDSVTDIYVCCSKGESRSPAVAAALLRMSGRSDKAVWCNPYYAPNTLVYLRLCRACGFLTNEFSVKVRELINRRAFRRVQKGKPIQYEQWQILE